MSEWISVKDRMPEPGEEVVLLSNDKREPIYDIGYQQPNGLGTWITYDGIAMGVTHWMPLPELPEEEDE